MIKEAEVQNAYLLGRQAAMEKLAFTGDIPEMKLEAGLKAPGIYQGGPQPSAAPQTPAYGGIKPQFDAGRDRLSVETAGGTMDSQKANAILQALAAAGENQMGVLGNIGLTGQGLTSDDLSLGDYDPRRLATMENLSRAGMLAGAGGGSYLGGMDPRAAAMASAGALGGGLVGGNLGQALGRGLQAAGVADGSGFGMQPEQLQRILQASGGALGGLGGGLGAGLMAR